MTFLRLTGSNYSGEEWWPESSEEDEATPVPEGDAAPTAEEEAGAPEDEAPPASSGVGKSSLNVH